jgi:glycosyltransferase involved in cell wall biosynthesis
VFIHKPSRLFVLYRLVVALFKGDPLQCALYDSPSAIRKINKGLQDADVAVCSVIRTASYIMNFSGPKIFDLADSLGQVYLHNKKYSTGLQKLAYTVEAPRLLRLEKNIISKAQAVFFFNKNEASYFGQNQAVHTVAHGVNPKLFSVETEEQTFSDGVTIIGKMNVAHNVDMVRWFGINVMPLLPDKIKLFIIGSDLSPDIISLSRRNPRIVLTGFLDDPYPAIRSSIACICPMQTGGGIQNKLIEGLAVGAVVISSSRAVSAFPNIHDSGIIVCDAPFAWASAIIEINENPSKFVVNKLKGREYARKYFSWAAYEETMINTINSSLNRSIQS